MEGHEHAGLLTDEAVLHNIAHGCEDCFDLLFLRFFRPVLNLAYKIIRDRSEAEGWNSRLDELQAAILRAKLPFLEAENARRREIADRYDAAFAELPVRRLSSRDGSLPARHLYPIRTAERDRLRERLAACGIETGVHYPEPIHTQPAYAFLGCGPGDFPVAEEASRTVLSLPIHPALSDAQVEAVVSAVRGFFEGPR